MRKKTELRIIPQAGQSVHWYVGDDGEVRQAINVVVDLTNGEGRERAIDPPNTSEENDGSKRIDPAYTRRAAFGNMLSAVAMLEKIIREPGLRNRYEDVCHVGAVAGWLKFAKGITQQNQKELRLARLRLGGGSIRLDDDTAGGSYCEYAVSETQPRLQSVMARFKPSAEVLRSPPETQMAFYSKSLRGIKGDVPWELPVLPTERLYKMVEMELREWQNSIPAAPLLSTSQATLKGISLRDAAMLVNEGDQDATDLKKPRAFSKPFRVNQWHRLFVAAKYSENESMRSFRRFLKEQLVSGTASRKTMRGAVCFELEFLATHKVKDPAD